MCDQCEKYASNKEFEYCPICGYRIIRVIGISKEEFYQRVVNDANKILNEFAYVSWDKVYYGKAYLGDKQDEVADFYKNFENYSWHPDFDSTSYINRGLVIEEVLFDAYFKDELNAATYITVRPKDFSSEVTAFLTE